MTGAREDDRQTGEKERVCMRIECQRDRVRAWKEEDGGTGLIKKNKGNEAVEDSGRESETNKGEGISVSYSKRK